MIFATAPDEPLVSVVLTAGHDRRQAARAIRAVMTQDYPAIECIVITDDAGAAGDASELREFAGDTRLRFVKPGQRLDQPGALFELFDQIAGGFVCLLDADDILTESFVSIHVAAHLSLGKPVAFTSSRAGRIDPDTCTEPRSADSGTAADRLAGRISIASWPQATRASDAGAANLYRREALRIAARCRSAATDRAANLYLDPFCQALGGSASIDLDLSFHDGDRRASGPDRELAAEVARFMLRESGFFRDWFGESGYWDALDRIVDAIAGVGFDRSSVLGGTIIRRLDRLQESFESRGLALQLSARLRGGRLLRLLATAPAGGRDRVRFALRVARYALRRRSATWLARKLRRPERAAPAPRAPAVDGVTPRDYGPVALLSDDPSIIKTGMAHDEWVGIAGAFARRFGNMPAGFLVYPTWSVEEPDRIAALGAAGRRHVRLYPSHRLIYMGNTQREAELIRGESLQSVFLNKNFTVSDQIFRPLPDVEPVFDAIYNARFVPNKRHALAAAIDRLAYVGYLVGDEQQQAEQTAHLDRLLAERPGHVLLNPVVDGVLTRLSPQDTNRCLNQARVGLCLSEIEGSSYASMEYMMAGLGVVSTPSSGGRDVYFDPEFCIICDPDPPAVRRAVAELVARDIPREHIRSRTLERVNVERRRFLDLIGDLNIELGGERPTISAWPYGAVSGMIRWERYDRYLATLECAPHLEGRAEVAAASDLLATDLPAIQLQPAELIPILRAIAAAPHCRLLVFGCGLDSPLWERVNRDGLTIFIEDDNAWARRSRSRLSTATVVTVDYGTRLAEWRALLGADEALALDLPASIRDTAWDVILVDGPAGYEDEQPGRMKSIYEAAKLIAPGGRVFVHDCERPVEQAYVARYLGEQRRFLSVSGRAMLCGYAF